MRNKIKKQPSRTDRSFKTGRVKKVQARVRRLHTRMGVLIPPTHARTHTHTPLPHGRSAERARPSSLHPPPSSPPPYTHAHTHRAHADDFGKTLKNEFFKKRKSSNCSFFVCIFCALSFLLPHNPERDEQPERPRR